MNKFVLCPARHSHKDIDGLPSIFKETQDIFNLELSSEFVDFIKNNSKIELSNVKLEVYVTGLTVAYEKLLNEVVKINRTRNESSNTYYNISVIFYHYDRSNDSYRTV